METIKEKQMIRKFPQSIFKDIGFYVYTYTDPRDNKIFYVGKGQNNRVFDHLEEKTENQKVKKIQEILLSGCEPKIDIIIHGLKTDEEAKRIEASIIDLLGIENLANQVRGYETRTYGKMSTEQICSLYATQEIIINEPSLLINLNRTFRYNLTPIELYDCTRASWVIGGDKEKVAYAFAVYQGIVQEVYKKVGTKPIRHLTHGVTIDVKKAIDGNSSAILHMKICG
jgi:hypothetical protein